MHAVKCTQTCKAAGLSIIWLVILDGDQREVYAVKSHTKDKTKYLLQTLDTHSKYCGRNWRG